ncbi:MAG: DEAD/DEAH box helicase [Desulfamplus sp.]|nr:DEAD/DEAH box helicase [Desulfamplus sp.]
MKTRKYKVRNKPDNERKILIKPDADIELNSVFSRIGVPAKKPFSPDSFQLKALDAIKHSDCLVTAPTGAGKTWIAERAADLIINLFNSELPTNSDISQNLDNPELNHNDLHHNNLPKKVWYATPLKALTNSIYGQFSKTFGKNKVGILTGDTKENADAAIIIGTTEILRNQLYDAMHTGEDLNCDLVILDEAHYLGDMERGVVWEEIIIYLPVRIPLLMLSATIGNPDHIAGWLEAIRGKKCHIIQESRRPVPLYPLFFNPSGTLQPLLKNAHQPGKQALLHKKTLEFLELPNPPEISLPGRLPKFYDILRVLKKFDLLPAIFFLKSRSDCDGAIRLCNSDLISAQPERKAALARRMEELVSVTPHLARHAQREQVEQTAAASHHSGQLPAWKVVVETLMSEGLLDAMFATSTVAAGVNFPARSVVILNSDRFNGTDFLPLTASEFQQMTGRAGRRGMDNIGFAILLPGKFMDLRHAARMVSAPPVDVQSQIRINFSMVLNLLLSHSPEQIRAVLKKSFASYMLNRGKQGKYARKVYGHELEFLWEDFLAHLDFLQQEGFVKEDGALTDDGLWASKLRIDAPLMVAHCLKYGLLPQNDPALFAAIMASFVNEKEFDDESLLKQVLPKILTKEFLDLRKGLRPFAGRMIRKGFDAPNLYLQPAATIFSWAQNEPWEDVVKRSVFAEGDLARLILRTAENLRQIAGLTFQFPEIAKTSEEAINLILKEPVITFYKEL